MTEDTFENYIDEYSLFWDCVKPEKFCKRLKSLEQKADGYIQLIDFFSKYSLESADIDYKIIDDFKKLINAYSDWTVKKYHSDSSASHLAPIDGYLKYEYIELANPENTQNIYLTVFHCGAGLSMLDSNCDALCVLSKTNNFLDMFITNPYRVMQGQFNFNGMHISFTATAEAFDENISVNFKDNKGFNKYVDDEYNLDVLKCNDERIKESFAEDMNELMGTDYIKVTDLKYKYLCEPAF